jgi:leucyl aminopeptidase
MLPEIIVDQRSTNSESTPFLTFLNHSKVLGTLPSHGAQNALENAAQEYQKKTLSTEFSTYVEDVFFLGFPIQDAPGLSEPETYRIAGSKAYKAAQSHSWDKLIVSLESASKEQVIALVQGFYHASYTFTAYKSKTTNNKKTISIKLSVAKELQTDIQGILADQATLFEGIFLCRDLVNTPGSDLTPAIFAEKVQKFSKGLDLKIKIREPKQLEKEQFNGLLTVGKGSPNPPRMITIEYDGTQAKSDTHWGFVGKGVTFDTGGISLKPGSGMWEMKMDMGGAATTFAATWVAAKLKLPVRLTTVLCLAENRPGQNAVLPGDIFTAKNGKTIMVENTDAEGRLVLSDGLAEAGLCGATHILDLATLTGAIIRALGPSIAGIFSNDSELAHTIKEQGATVGEKFWELPLEQEYQSYIEDKVADIKNLGKVDAGSITAGLFLQEFVPEGAKWAHLDIAGTAFTTSTWKYFAPGGTGWGVQSLISLLTFSK